MCLFHASCIVLTIGESNTSMKSLQMSIKPIDVILIKKYNDKYKNTSDFFIT